MEDLRLETHPSDFVPSEAEQLVKGLVRLHSRHMSIAATSRVGNMPMGYVLQPLGVAFIAKHGSIGRLDCRGFSRENSYKMILDEMLGLKAYDFTYDDMRKQKVFEIPDTVEEVKMQLAINGVNVVPKPCQSAIEDVQC